jgi:hypothetical protein
MAAARHLRQLLKLNHYHPNASENLFIRCFGRYPLSMSLKRIALVTGAAQGIGRAIAIRLAEDGLDVAVNDIPSKREILDSLVQEIVDKGNRSLAVTADVSVEDEVKGMVEQVVKDLGGLDVVSARTNVCVISANKGQMVANAGLVTLNSVLDSKAFADFLRFFVYPVHYSHCRRYRSHSCGQRPRNILVLQIRRYPDDRPRARWKDRRSQLGSRKEG